jgi:hypothetical protein
MSQNIQASTTKGYRIIDRRGKQASSLYPSPSANPTRYRPRYYSVGDTPKVVTAYDRNDHVNLGRSLFTSCPDLGGALLQKSSWVVGPGSFTPIYTGADKEWGDAAEEWLVNQFFPVCSTLGPNYPFTQLLYLTSLSIDIDGDTGMFLTTNRSGFPQVGLCAAHRIGNRYGEDVVASGKFEGYKIVDGCILNDSGRVIGYRILGDKAVDDYDISAANFQLLFESEWCDQLRGISRIARSVTDWVDQEDINEYIKRGVKLGASIGLISKTESGDAIDSGANIIGMDEEIAAPTDNGLSVEAIQGGEILYMKSGMNETIETLKDERPTPNTEAFMNRIQKRALYSIGWMQEMLDASKIGGAAVRLVQDLARKSVAQRQVTIERRAKLIVNFAIAKAMNLGFIPQNNGDWFKWTFTKGGVITVDNGNEASADREGFKLGTVTLSEMSSKKGVDWYELRDQQQKETEDLLDRAVVISKKYNIGMDAALSLLSQRAPNQMPVIDEPAEIQDNNVEEDIQ